MNSWMYYALAAAILYGLHQIFTRLAATGISEGFGGFIVELVAALTIAIYVGVLYANGTLDTKMSINGIIFSTLTGICVGSGTIMFFLLFQRGGQLSVVPAILAIGSALMVIAGFAFFKEAISWQKLAGILLSIVGLFLLKYSK